MDIQMFVVGIIFLAAFIYVGRRIFMQFKGKSAAGCEKCGTVEKVKEINN